MAAAGGGGAAAGRAYSFKVVLLGEGCVGKTSLVLRYCENKFNDKHITTLQVRAPGGGRGAGGPCPGPRVWAHASQACDLHIRIAFPNSSWGRAGSGQPVDGRTGACEGREGALRRPRRLPRGRACRGAPVLGPVFPFRFASAWARRCRHPAASECHPFLCCRFFRN